MKFVLQRVHYMPQDLHPGVLYISDEYDIAIHLCACGCGAKIRTPLGPTEWRVSETGAGPSLYPSIGNWQQLCQSHYWIRGGKVVWDVKWTPEQIAAGRRREEERRRAYFDALDRECGGTLRKFWRWLKKLLGR